MSLIYLSQGFTVYPHRQVIERGNDVIQVRPKTFALLLLLLEKPHEVLTKQHLLNTIWDDVTVDEPVLVQSVRELRQLFGNAEIIQTYPRKGYAWAADVEKQDSNTQKITPNTQHPITTTHKNRTYTAFTIGIILIVVFSGIFYSLLGRHHSVPPKTEVVIVLPVKNQMPGNDHNWVPLGGMDQLIHLLVSDKSVQVMDTEYVLHLMEIAQLPRAYDTQKVSRIFNVSGATLIVEPQLSGTVESYQLDYKLRYKNDIKRGVVFDKDLSQAIRKLAQVIVSQTGQKIQNADTSAQAAFANELMARALEKINQNELEPAQNLLTSLKELEPNNILARQQLIKVLLWLKKFDQTKEEINQTLLQVKVNNQPAPASIYYYQGLLNVAQGRPGEALVDLEQAENLAALSNDILTRAAIAEARGTIHQNQGDLKSAQTAFEQAIEYHDVIRCPIGISDSHIKLAKLFSTQGKYELAMEHYNAAKNLIETHQLDDMKAQLEAANPSRKTN